MKKIILCIALLPFVGFSQEGKPMKSIAIPRVDLPKPDKTPETSVNAPQYSISKPFEPIKFNSTVKTKTYPPIQLDKPMDFNSKASDLNPSAVYDKKYNDAMNKEYPGFSARDQFFGEIKTKSKFVKVVYFDYATPDNDYIKMWMNDVTVIGSSSLNMPQEIVLDLLLVTNKIDFEALNEGDASPNTAQFNIYDDKDNLIYTNRWELSTGFKASIFITKER